MAVRTLDLMKLDRYVVAELKRLNARNGTRIGKTAFLRELAEKSGVSLLTLQNVERGGRIVRYDKAKQVSKATGGKVTIRDLCE